MTTDTTADSPPTWRAWAGLILLALPLFMMATDYTVLFMAMPTVAADLAPSTTQMLWIMHVAEFVAAGLVITMGRLADKVGRRRLLLVGMTLYGSVSALAAFAPTPDVLLTARVLAGLSVAAASPVAFSMVRSMFSGAHIGVAWAVLMGAFSAGAALGPPMGGVLLEHFWWGSVFLINVPVAVIVLAAGSWILPRPAATNGARIDVSSVALSMTAVMLGVFGLQEVADKGVSAPYLVAVAVGGALGAIFLRRQRRLAEPLLDLGLFRIRALRVVAVAFVLTTLAFVAVDFILIQYLQIVNGVPAARLGLLMAAPGIAAIVGTSLTPVLSRRLVPSHLMAGGAGVGLVGAALILAALAVAPQVTALFVVGTTILSLGFSPLMVLGSQLIVTSAPEERSGSAVAIQDVSTGIGGAMGLALLGSLAMAVFGRMLGVGAPGEVSASDLDDAGQSPGGAVAVADRIGGQTGRDLLTAVQDAWTVSTTAAYGTAFLLGVGVIVIVLRGLRGIRLPSDTPDELPASTTPERADARS